MGAKTIVSVTAPANGTVTITGGGTGLTYASNANFCGSDSFSYTLAGGSSATVSVTIECVNDAPVAVDDTATVDEDAAATTIDVLANDFDPEGDPFLIVSVGDALHGTTEVTGGGSRVSYEPDADYCGTDSFTYTITGGSSATVAVNVTCVDDAPTAVDDTMTVLEDAAATAVPVLANDLDPDGGPISISSVTQPANGVVVITGGGSGLTYQPDPEYCNSVSGTTDDFTYTLAPGGSTANVAVTVTCVDDPPVAVNDVATTAQGAAPMSIDVLANDTDIDGGPKKVVSASDPANGTVVVAGDGLSLTYQPDPAYCNDGGGPLDTFTYTLNGGSTATVSVTVTCDVPPIAVDDAATVIEDASATAIDVLANDTDGGDGGPVVVVSVTQPTNGTVTITGSGSGLDYQPNANYCNSVAGTTDDFTYTLNGGSTATVTVTVTCVDDPPVAVNDSATVAEDAPATAIDVLANDTDIDGGPKTIQSVTQPANGTVVITGGGTGLTYQPGPDYCNDGTPVDTFTYTLNGGSTATVSMTVTCVADSTTAVADSATVEEDSAATAIDVLANDLDPDPVGLSITSATDPANGTVVLTGGSPGAHTGLTYQPDADYCGLDTFDYTIAGGSSATVTVTVSCVNDAPVATVPAAAQTVDEDQPLYFSSVGGNALSVSDIDAGGGSVTVSVSALHGKIFPASMSGAIIAGSGTASATITGTLAQVNAALDGLRYEGDLHWNSTRGTETLTLAVNDGGNTGSGGALTDSATVDITVNAVNDAPVAVAKSYSAQANMRITGLTGLLTGATDPDTGDGGYSAVLTVGTISATTTPAGGNVLNLDPATGTFDFDPPPGATGDVTFTYTVCDSGSPAPSLCSSTATVTVNVAGPAIWFVDPAASTNGDGRLSSPFNNLASAASADASGHRIFIYSGAVPAAGITLNTNEWLIGQGVTGSDFDTLFGITPPAGTMARPAINGTRPVIQGNVVVAANDAVRGLNIVPPSGTAGLTGTGTDLAVNDVSVTTANAAAVSLANGGGTLAFTTINANGGPNGIVLNNMTGSFTVAGTGGTCTAANQSGCSGGVIRNTTGADDSGATPVGTGIALNNVENVSLARMHIHGHTNYGIRGNSVNGFTLDTSVVGGVNGTNASSPFSDSSISFDNLSGTSKITNSDISGGYQRNLRIDNTTGALILTLDNNKIHDTGATAGDDGVLIEIGGGGAQLTVTNNTFTKHGGDHFNLSLVGNPNVDLTFTGNDGSPGSPAHPIGLGQGFFIAGGTFDGSLTYTISNNTVRGTRQGGAIHVNKGSGTGHFLGRIENNVIGLSGQALSGASESSGIVVASRGGGSHLALVNGNTVQQYNEMGISLEGAENGTTTLYATVTNNTVREPGPMALHGIHLNWGVLNAGTSAACVDIRNNDASAGGNEGAGGYDYRLRQRDTTTVQLPGYGGANNDNTAVQNFIAGQNTGAETVLAGNTVPTGGGFVGGAPCPQP